GNHEPDFLKANQPWFLGVEMEYGPDGAVYLSDWVDLGECHGRDGIHRTSGRIYRITFGDPVPVKMDISKLDDMTLLGLFKHRNEWFVRRARRLLQERAAAGSLVRETSQALHSMLETEKDV
ncbi:MAG: dehydrogenase, partial [Planctomycetota bacterium]|nr:dehydrogenase [Planctomycetota bacterium]